MRTDITIPPAALEAAASAYTAVIYRGNGTTAEFHEAIRAACLAMLENWPGMRHYPDMEVFASKARIILPQTRRPHE